MALMSVPPAPAAELTRLPPAPAGHPGQGLPAMDDRQLLALSASLPAGGGHHDRLTRTWHELVALWLGSLIVSRPAGYFRGQ
jgi:hypothetical protein